MWKEVNNKLVKIFMFADFVEAWTFLQKVAIIAEREQHHPEIENIYNKVILKLCTHDAGNVVTEKDKNLAIEIDNLKG